MAQPLIVQASKVLIVDLVGGILGFPFWWYGKGVKAWTGFVWDWFGTVRAQLGVQVWIKNIFVPMYGSYDIAGRLISFFMRVAMIVLRSIGLFLASGLLLVVYLSYFVLPVLVAGAVLYHGLGSMGLYG